MRGMYRLKLDLWNHFLKSNCAVVKDLKCKLTSLPSKSMECSLKEQINMQEK